MRRKNQSLLTYRLIKYSNFDTATREMHHSWLSAERGVLIILVIKTQFPFKRMPEGS